MQDGLGLCVLGFLFGLRGLTAGLRLPELGVLVVIELRKQHRHPLRCECKSHGQALDLLVSASAWSRIRQEETKYGGRGLGGPDN